MEEIIKRLTTEMVKNICEKAFCSKWRSLAELVGDVKEIYMTTGCEESRRISASINKTINPVHFADEAFDTMKLY